MVTSASRQKSSKQLVHVFSYFGFSPSADLTVHYNRDPYCNYNWIPLIFTKKTLISIQFHWFFDEKTSYIDSARSARPGHIVGQCFPSPPGATATYRAFQSRFSTRKQGFGPFPGVRIWARVNNPAYNCRVCA